MAGNNADGHRLDHATLHFDTNAVHAGQEPEKWASRAVVPPISMATTFKQKSPAEPFQFDYSRSGNPTRNCLEECIAALEHAKYGITYSSGLAATHNVTHLLNAGDHVVSFNDLYGGTHCLFKDLLIRRGFEVTFVDLTDISNLEPVLRPNTKLVWLETPSNPTMKVVDIKAVCEIVHKKCEAIVAVDNTFMSSYFQKPLLLGADISVHSLTKYMNGHSDVVMGAVCTNDEKINEQLRYFQNAAGAVPSPFDCFLVNRGLKTLHVRMERHMQNGLKVARFLEAHPLVEKVMHPGLPSHPQYEVAKRQCSGFSGMVTFRLKGGLKESTLFLKNLKIVTLADSLGSTESLAELPAVMTHAALPEEQRRLLGITDNLIRLSVGLENSDDLIRDIDQALNKAIRV
ncbi:cystathionine gamma-lyase-like [Haemaphysalis longicornis]